MKHTVKMIIPLSAVTVFLLVFGFFTYGNGSIADKVNTEIIKNRNVLNIFSSGEDNYPVKVFEDILFTENGKNADGIWNDIAELNEKYTGLINKGEYPESGKTEERDMSRFRATDSFENVFIQNATDTKKVDIKSVLEKGSGLKIKKDGTPDILIYHTHTTECYKIIDNGVFSDKWNSRTDNVNLSVVRVGDELAKQLELNGFNVIHDRTVYDSTYSGAYARSRKTVEEYLKKYPDLLVTIDLHRDAIYENEGLRYKCTTQADGGKAAQIMIITGVEEGYITDFPNWETNLSFALQIQKKCSEMYPSLMRPVFFARRDYNMDLTPYSLLFEFGTDANTLEEAVRSGECMGKVLSAVLEDCIIE